MKKMYFDPEFEFVNIRLVADIVGSSTTYEDDVPIDGTTPGDEEFDTEW